MNWVALARAWVLFAGFIGALAAIAAPGTASSGLADLVVVLIVTAVMMWLVRHLVGRVLLLVVSVTTILAGAASSSAGGYGVCAFSVLWAVVLAMSLVPRIES